eukprot:COSAG01_NODE_9289_length_2493_cov_192.326650_2_plen_137_part_00
MNCYQPLEGSYGYNSFFDNLSANELYEYTLAPQHNTQGVVDAVAMREAQDKELERQVKRYGKDELQAPIHADDGLGQADNEVYARSFQLKGKGERRKQAKKKEPTHRLRQHLFKGTKVTALKQEEVPACNPPAGAV